MTYKNSDAAKANKGMEIQFDTGLRKSIQRLISVGCLKAYEDLNWLYSNMHPYFFITMQKEVAEIVNLVFAVGHLATLQRVSLVDNDKKLIVACLDTPGSLYAMLKGLNGREISYAEVTHSYEPIRDCKRNLEIQKFEFARKSHEEIRNAGQAKIPKSIRRAIHREMRNSYPEFEFAEFDRLLSLLWLNNENYVRISPPRRIARVLWIYQQGRKHDGLYFNMEVAEETNKYRESRLSFAVGNPPAKGFLTQIMEVFQRLNIGVRRLYCLNISNGTHSYFLGNFYVSPRDSKLLEKGSHLYEKLQTELYNTQILSPASIAYKDFVGTGLMTGVQASLTNAFVAFCHTILAHSQPDRFSLEAVESAFHAHPEITLKLIKTFETRFDPAADNRDEAYQACLTETNEAVERYNTGRKHLDEVRKKIFRTCLIFVSRILKTNFFVPEKHALAFRLDPKFLAELGQESTVDLPQEIPFRVTFFFGRYGVGYHVGFSDIARGGLRTVISRNKDEYLTNANNLFREVFVLAHTQHLKNKDIYEGGSKMTVVLDAEALITEEAVTQRLYKLQYGFINAFFDIFVTENGRAKSPYVIDYYKQDEPIELGPDENMHDTMIEFIARQAVERGYMLGVGIISGKSFGINHKQFGVTSRGVIKFAEIAMREIGSNIYQDPFTVRMTGGPNGDVAGNSMRLLLERCPQGRILSILDGWGALYDPEGIDRQELGTLVLHRDVIDFDAQKLHEGGFILFRHQRRREGLQELHRKLMRSHSGIEECWVTTDELYREFDDLVFSVSTDLFLPCGGRPETIDESNWQRLFAPDGTPSVRVIVEGANSFISPRARDELQKHGVILLRDSSANKCGVIASSYEIIANLLMTEAEFLKEKDRYVEDVLSILEKRAEAEANLIFKRYHDNGGALLHTDISTSISKEINALYAVLFSFFEERPALLEQSLFRRTLLQHLPRFIQESPKYRSRLRKLPKKIKSAILASEISTLVVYQGGWETHYESRLRDFLKQKLS